MSKLDILVDEVENEVVRENFRRLKNTLDSEDLLSGQIEIREYEFLAAVSNKQIAHGLPFEPQDVLLTRKTGAGVLTIHYDKIDRTFLEFTTTGPCVVRLLVGTFGGLS